MAFFFSVQPSAANPPGGASNVEASCCPSRGRSSFSGRYCCLEMLVTEAPIVWLGGLVPLLVACLAPPGDAAGRAVVPFDVEWRFHLGDFAGGDPLCADQPKVSQLMGLAQLRTLRVETACVLGTQHSVHNKLEGGDGIHYKVCDTRLKPIVWVFTLNQKEPMIFMHYVTESSERTFPGVQEDAFIPFDGMSCPTFAHAGAYSLTEAECRRYCCGDPNCAAYVWAPILANWCGIGSSTHGCKSEKDDGWMAANFTGGKRAIPAPIAQPRVSGPQSTGFDDSKWRVLSLPHDFVVEQAPVKPPCTIVPGRSCPNGTSAGSEFGVCADSLSRAQFSP